MQNPAAKHACQWLIVFPTALTLGNLCCGIAAIVVLAWANAYSADFTPALMWASGLVVLAAMLDGVDGRVARRLNVVTRFGTWLDAVADWASFGLVPALALIPTIMVADGIAVRSIVGGLALFYVMAMAWRLWRFLRESRMQVAAGFRGLPAPGAGLLAMGCILILGSWTWIVMLVLIAAMVSRVSWSWRSVLNRLLCCS